MSTHPSISPDPVERFWDRYLELLSKQGIKKSAQRWYVLRAEHYIKTFPDKKLARHTAEDIVPFQVEVPLGLEHGPPDQRVEASLYLRNAALEIQRA